MANNTTRNFDCIPTEVYVVANRISSAGGRALLVGGSIPDMINGKTPKDWDLEVFGLDYEQIMSLFPDYPCKDVGKAFGVIKVNVNGVDLDLNVPRVDNSIGKGHKDFIAVCDPQMTVKEAARRRDFTINTLAYDLETSEIINEWGGLEDLQAGILRATDSTLFPQDPVRALRAMQLCPRKLGSEGRVEGRTMDMIRAMRSGFPFIAKERIYEEFRKLLLKADKPSVGLSILRESGWISEFPELEALIDCPQKPEWHPEGDVWVHSCLAADAAAEIRDYIPEKQREAFVFGTFLHDVGKPDTTVRPEHVEKGLAPKEMLLTAHGHDQKGMDPAESFLRRMTNNKKLIELTRGIVGLHMQPYNLNQGNAGKGAYARLSRKMQDAGGDLRLLGHVCQCDACATSTDWQTRSLTTGGPNWEHVTSEKLMDWADEFDKDASAVDPKVMGRDLIARGLKGGPMVGKLLKQALELQYEDPSLSKEDLINQVMPGDVA